MQKLTSTSFVERDYIFMNFVAATALFQYIHAHLGGNNSIVLVWTIGEKAYKSMRFQTKTY